jgi:hypothetical protein
MMKIKHTRITSVILSLVLLLSFFPLSGSSAAVSPRYDDGRYMEFMDDTASGKAVYEQYKDLLPQLPGGGAPPRYKMVQGTKLYVNYRLWMDQGVLCYGNYAKVPKNDFKNSTKKPGQPAVKNDGYYSKNGKRGEYRYHGYDVNGNPLTNLNFEPDSVVTKFNERAWIKNPWTDLPPDKRPQQRSIYNDAATGREYYADPSVQPSVRNWINASLREYGGVPLIGDVVDPEVFRYLYVESAPTILGIGQGRMWHDRNGTIWYQTIAIPQIKMKENLPVNARIELLTKLPEEMTDLGTGMDDRELTLKFRVTGMLMDEEEYSDPVKMTVYYTRHDIKDWTISFTGPEQPAQVVSNARNVSNKGSTEFEYKTTYGFLKTHSRTVNGKTTWNLRFTATAKPNYRDGKQGLTGNTAYDLGIGVVELPPPPVTIIENFSPENHIPETAFEGVPFAASDNTDMSKVASRRVLVDGVEVDDDLFFSGDFIFEGDFGENGRFAYVDCEYQVKGFPGDEGKLVTRDVVYIYPTKPIANFKISSNTWKENRFINVQNTCDEGNIDIVIQKYPIVQYEWTYGGDVSQLRKGTDTDFKKQLLYKKPGIYSLTLRCKNTLGRWSEPYTVDFEVVEDIGPAVGVNLSDAIYTRKDTVTAWYYDVVSTDGDVVASSTIELWHDSDNDGTLDRKLKTWSNQEQFPEYVPEKLGYYKYTITAKEDFTDDTLPEYITEADKKTSSYSVEFWVDNYRPLSDLYVNIPIQRPSIDIFFMLDKNLDLEMKDYMLNNRVNMSNWLLGRNIIPNVNIWDMRTYTYSQPATTSRHTGSSYPPATITYTSSGYSGTLQRTSVSNNRYSRDEGHYETRTESKTATGTASGYARSVYECKADGSWSLVYSESSDTPSISYSDSAGFRGTLYKTRYTLDSDNGPPASPGTPGSTYTRYRSYTGYYSGTVTRTVKVWVPNIVWYDDYTGYYSGTVYKDVRQPYTDPFAPTSEKYVVYISNDTISELNDLNMVMGLAKSAKLYLAGSSAIKEQGKHDRYFGMEGKTIAQVADEILNEIAENSPSIEKYYVLQNESFEMNVGQFDLEDDEIVEEEMQYVHEPGYFDNPTGNEPGTVPLFDENTGWISEVKSEFLNTGKYTIYRRVKDRPSDNPAFGAYSYYSGLSFLEIFVVRKPIAKAVLDWDFDPVAGVYKTTWVDMSYDPDHQFSRPDKGIVDRKITWRKTGGQWNYGIPDNLAPGTYELEYYVIDPEGFWSDPFIMNFTLSPVPGMQFRASLRTLDARFRLDGVPASEELEAYDLWTRFPGNVWLEMALYKGASGVAPVKKVEFGSATGTKINNDITWKNVIYNIPDTLPDGIYDFKISAIGDNGQSATKSFEVNVSTPLDLNPSMPDEVTGGTNVTVAASTAKYAETVTVTLFHGTSHERKFNLVQTGNGGNETKTWENTLTIPDGIPDGNYIARFTAVTFNGNVQTKDLAYKLTNLAITGVELSGYWNHWRGQVDLFGKRLTNEPHRFLSLECVKVRVATIGNPERITIRFSPELEAMRYTDKYGHTYDYNSDFFGYEVNFPKDSTFNVTENQVYWEYYLPLAPSTKDWDDNRLRPPYSMTVTAYKGEKSVSVTIDDIEITGNIYDLTYIQPKQ